MINVEIISIILFGAFVFFALMIFEDSLTNYLDARADEIRLANGRIEDITEKEAFERIAYRYPARPEELEMILDKYYSGGFVEVEFYGRLIGELERLKKKVVEK